MKKLILIILILGGVNFSVKSSHAVGGDIRFVQTGANSYTVSMRLFRYCTGAGLGPSYTIQVRDQVTCASSSTVTVTRINQFNIPFGDDCYTPPGLCVEQHEYTGTITTLLNNPNGYIATWSLCCRNAVDNLAGGSLGLYTKIPDPALAGGNSTPTFVDYPRDGYFCVNEIKCIDFTCLDTDGDSLRYELVNPINTFTGCTPNYSTWAPGGYGLPSVLGPGSRCFIPDPTSGCVMARPSRLGVFVISVKVSEYRNGVQIGETVRDLQYASLNCNTNELPSYYDFEEIKVLKFDETHCFDVAAFDKDPEDTFFIDVTSNAFAYGATVSLPTPNTSGLYDFSWTNPIPGGKDSITNVNVKKLTATKFEGIGKIGVRFCWTIDDCEVLSIDTFKFNMFGYSLGCDGSIDSVEKIIKIVIENPKTDHIVSNVFSPNGDGVNDNFHFKKSAYDRCYDVLTVGIYNRWGQLVFESDDPLFEWNGNDKNGKELSAGSYFVVVSGYYSGKEVTQNFPLTLFR
ncbi:MAG: gliding motility-associated-like protein [Flavobacteriales bacterium]|mgnify:FL=1|jgi:gliding motility-associated-like protein|tara:strand:- start:7960 stop:9501 length:1542 start_codon:yes stop_codon:yes gene_type:complete